MRALPLGSSGLSRLTGTFFVFCSCFWARSFSANLCAFRGLEEVALEQNGLEHQVNKLPGRELLLRTRRPGVPKAGAAILPRAGRDNATQKGARKEGGGLWWSRGRRPAGHVGGARSLRLRRPVAAAGAVAFGADAVSVWGSQARDWKIPVPQRFSRGPDLCSWRALPWEACRTGGYDPTQKPFPAPASF